MTAIFFRSDVPDLERMTCELAEDVCSKGLGDAVGSTEGWVYVETQMPIACAQLVRDRFGNVDVYLGERP